LLIPVDTIIVQCNNDVMIATALVVLLFFPAFIGIILGCLRNRESVSLTSMSMCAISCIAGIFAFPAWCVCGDIHVDLGMMSAIGPYGLLINDISALMISVSSFVFLLVIIHMSGSSHVKSDKYMALMNGLFIASVMCMCANTVAVLLIGWECVSLLTYLMADRPREEEHRWMFFVTTHIGGLMLIGVYAYLVSVTGTFVLSDWHGISAKIGVAAASVMVFLLFMGFGSKLGLIPFHAWMPEMYRTSPTHTAILLSTVCSNVAILLLFKSVFGYMGITNDMTAVAVILIALSSVSAIWGAMESMIQNKPKRILAYSSMENMSLVCLCLSMAMIFSTAKESLMVLVLIAGLLHTINHSVFKSLMLMTVHTVEDSTGETDINSFGGLGRTLPLLSFVAIIGVASLAAIPPMNGFASEWLMLQSMISGDASENILKLIMPLTVAVLGVCGMMAATSYVRLYGFTYLGRPRSNGAKAPKKVNPLPMVSMIILATTCVVMGLMALQITDVLAKGINNFLGTTADYRASMSGNFDPLILGLMIIGTIAILFVIFRSRRDNGESTGTWACGGELEDNMQYSSAGFSQPLVRVFHPIYGDTIELSDDEDHKKVHYHVKFIEPFKKYIYVPIAKATLWVAKQVGRLQTGNIQSYLVYILIVMVVALLAVRIL